MPPVPVGEVPPVPPVPLVIVEPTLPPEPVALPPDPVALPPEPLVVLPFVPAPPVVASPVLLPPQPTKANKPAANIPTARRVSELSMEISFEWLGVESFVQSSALAFRRAPPA